MCSIPPIHRHALVGTAAYVVVVYGYLDIWIFGYLDIGYWILDIGWLDSERLTCIAT